jgi:hypothetical protein
MLTQAQFARRVGVSRQAINRAVRDGVIPVHGPHRLIDPVEAAACYQPRCDAGEPQLRLGDPRAETAMGHAVALAAWLEWADTLLGPLAACATMADLRRVLHLELGQRLAALGLVTADADALDVGTESRRRA